MTDCAILGGGLAGLSAAVKLAGEGRSIALFEARPHCGGRASAFTDRRTGERIDNGQHILMGCYTEMLSFLETIGSADLLTPIRRMRLPFHTKRGESATMKTRPFPYPFDALSAFFGFRLLSLPERLGSLRVLLRTKYMNAGVMNALDAISVETWLRHLRQTENAIEHLWSPIVLATMNARIHEASAYLFAVVLREAFLSGRKASTFLVPSCDLSTLYVDGALQYLSRRNAHILSHTRVESIRKTSNGFAIAAGPTAIEATAVIVALPPAAYTRLVGHSPVLADLDVKTEHFEPSEIISAHIWITRPITEELMTGFLGTTLQWLFSKGQAKDGKWRYTGVISAANELRGYATDALTAIVKTELCAVYDGLEPDDISRIKLVREYAATFIPRPGIEKFRPLNNTRREKIFLAGDWTATSLPATIEGAVRSGHRAAALVSKHFVRESSQ